RRSGARQAGVEGHLSKVIVLEQVNEPALWSTFQLQLACRHFDGDFPGGDRRDARVIRPANLRDSTGGESPGRQRQEGAGIENDVHSSSGHSSFVSGSAGSYPGVNVTWNRGSGARLRSRRRVGRRRISATSTPSRQSTTVSLRSSTARTSSERRDLASCMLTRTM